MTGAFARNLVVICCSAAALAPVCGAAGLIDDLDAEQKGNVLAGQQVVVMENVEGKPWPRLKIYKIVKSSPEEAMAVFFDYANAKTFVPNLLKSEVSKTHTAVDVEVDYGVDVPILPDEFYTARNRLVGLPGGQYRIEWKLVRAVQTKDSEGSFCAQPFAGNTIIRYENLVVPGSSMAGLLRGKAIDQMKQTAAAIAMQIESQKSSHPADLERQVTMMKAALGDRKGD